MQERVLVHLRRVGTKLGGGGDTTEEGGGHNIGGWGHKFRLCLHSEKVGSATLEFLPLFRVTGTLLWGALQ